MAVLELTIVLENDLEIFFGPAVVPGPGYILMETGDIVLMETNDKILKE